MRIMFCLGSMTKGGAERVVANLSDNFSKHGDIVSIIVTPPGRSAYPLNSKVSFRTLDDDKNHHCKIVRNIRRMRRLSQYIRDFNPDVIIGMIPEPCVRLLLVNFFNRRKIIISERNDPRIEYNTPFKRAAIKILYKRADGFIFQTKDAQEFFSKKVQAKSVIIPNPLNPEFIVDKPYNGRREKTIVSVGRLEPQKNHKMLVEAFANISSRFPEYKLVIYGEGSLRENLEQLAEKLGIADRVELPGEVDNIKDKIYRASCFVLSSDYEGMPNALMEAMALGVPCISTDCPCGGPRSLIGDNKGGVLVPINDSHALSLAIQKIIKNSNLAKQIVLEAHHVSAMLSPEIILQEWKNFIQATIV